jgi:hypothetical protein
MVKARPCWSASRWSIDSASDVQFVAAVLLPCTHVAKTEGDFAEGVRSLLVDRDNAPKWQHASYKAVPADLVARFFQPLTNQPEWDPSQYHGHAAPKL